MIPFSEQNCCLVSLSRALAWVFTIKQRSESASNRNQVPQLLWNVLNPGLPDVFFKTKIPIWVNFVGHLWYSLWQLGLFYVRLGHFMTIWCILCSFGTFFRFLVSCTKKNLATLLEPPDHETDQVNHLKLFNLLRPFISTYPLGLTFTPRGDAFPPAGEVGP
jgi:hypothetical protein